jgi:hypothetical protein
MTQYFVPQVTDGKVGKPDLATLEVNLLGASLSKSSTTLGLWLLITAY